MENITQNAGEIHGQQIGNTIGREFAGNLSWKDLSEFRAVWHGKLILKGVLRPDDAMRAFEVGCDAVVVSNHGGRQLDGSSATLRALPHVRCAAPSSMKVFVDGGIRRGSDIMTAIALGADAVWAGRPLLYGVCSAGEAGALRAIDILQDELVRTMTLCGIANVAGISPDALI